LQRPAIVTKLDNAIKGGDAGSGAPHNGPAARTPSQPAQLPVYFIGGKIENSKTLETFSAAGSSQTAERSHARQRAANA
jgi:hypothetical protein